MVVSDMNERLSPKKAPPTTTPTKSGKELPVAVARPAAMGTRATMQPTLVPMAMLTKQVVRKMTGRINRSGTMRSMSATVESMQPMSLALAAKAPANTNTQSMSMMPGLPAPLLNVSTRCCMGPRLMAMA